MHTTTQALAVCLAFGLAGCGPKFSSEDAHPGQLITETKAIEKDKAELVKVDLEIAAGELQVRGGTPKLMEAEFMYNVERWKPVVRYDGSSFRGHLEVKQDARGTGTTRDIKNEWTIKLSEDVPLDVVVSMGAGKSNLELGNLKLRSVEVRIGAGRCEVDLRGKVDRSYSVNVRGGVGEAIIRVPKDAGVLAKAAGGIGEIQVHGLTKDGDSYRNEVYGKAKNTIQVDVKGGIGTIHIYSE